MEYSEPTKIPDGRYFVRISNKDGRIFEQINRAEFSRDNCFQVKDNKDQLNKYDDMIIQEAVKSSETWFSKKLEEPFLRGVYESSISDGVLEAPFAKIKGSVVAIAFDTEKERVNLESVVPGSSWDIVIELVGIWFLKKTFGPVWRVIQLRHSKTRTPTVVPKDYMFSDETDISHQEDDYEDI